ncbi:hypothetical protein [Streptomyces sp. NPDC002133]|uniref:hypothetical protein n=1 Tax=Streptomyces sp. NPDC002133 TaxID=3154409 RepID=UPI00332E5942
MVKKVGKVNPARKSIIVVAGEGNNDREVLKHLIGALLPKPCPKIVPITRQTHLAKAEKFLQPRVDDLRRLANAAAATQHACLAGIVVHVDFDGAESAHYDKVRRRISAELVRTFGPEAKAALALAVSETEGWLMLFPKAFPKVRSGWNLPEEECRRDLGRIPNAKEHLKRLLKQPPYRESDAPSIMREAAQGGLITARPSGTNRSYTDFAGEISAW